MVLKKHDNVGDVIAQALTELRSRGYKPSYVHHHRFIYSALELYCTESTTDEYSEAIGEQFLTAVKVQKPHLRHHTMNEYRMAIRRLNCTLTTTEWRPFNNRDVPYVSSCYNSIITEYEIYLYEKGKTRVDVRAHMHALARFLRYTEQQGCVELSALRPKIIFDAFKETTDKCCFRNVVGSFLRYAYKYKLIDINLSIIVPSVLPHTPVPTVYSPEEIETLLASIDRRAEFGKRNYAMILIAARLGLRACDIADMKFSCLHSDAGTIEIIQAKTKQPLVLPLLDDVKSAIDDYVDNTRPQCADEHIFLNLRGYGAVSPQTVTANVQRAFEKSGINRSGRKRGSHSLRSSLASALLAEGNDYPTIQKVLGQKDIQSTRSYVKADIEKLRAYALPVPTPSANYTAALAAVGGFA